MPSNILRQPPVTYGHSFRVEKCAQDRVKADWTLHPDGWFIKQGDLAMSGETFGCPSCRDVIGIW